MIEEKNEKKEFNINEKLKVYISLKNDIELLSNYQQVIRGELENYFKQQKIDSLRTNLGLITYVTKEYETIDKKVLEEILTEEMKSKVFIKKESKYITIRENMNKK